MRLRRQVYKVKQLLCLRSDEEGPVKLIDACVPIGNFMRDARHGEQMVSVLLFRFVTCHGERKRLAYAVCLKSRIIRPDRAVQVLVADKPRTEEDEPAY